MLKLKYILPWKLAQACFNFIECNLKGSDFGGRLFGSPTDKPAPLTRFQSILVGYLTFACLGTLALAVLGSVYSAQINDYINKSFFHELRGQEINLIINLLVAYHAYVSIFIIFFTFEYWKRLTTRKTSMAGEQSNQRVSRTR